MPEVPGAPRPRVERSFSRDATAGPADTINCTVKIIRHQQRSILHRKDVDWTPDVVVVLNEPGDERFHRTECAIVVQFDDHHIATNLYAAIPRSVPGE